MKARILLADVTNLSYIYENLLKVNGKLIELYSHFDYNGQ